MDQLWLWIGFNLFVLAMLALDLGVFHRHAHDVSIKEAGAWTAVWVTLALAFNYGIYHFMGAEVGLEFLAGYLIEKALGVGAALIHEFHWILYLFGAFLVITGVRMATRAEHTIEMESNPVIRLLRRLMPVSQQYHGQKFFIRESIGGRLRLVATPLLVVLVLVETTDLIFALDSIPAVFAVTTDPFIVYTSNVFAILGLRALYFMLAGVIHKFHYLRLGLSAVLVFVGLKMLVAYFGYQVPIEVSLSAIGGVLMLSIAASLLFPK